MSDATVSKVGVPETWRGMDKVPARFNTQAMNEVDVLVLSSIADMRRFTTRAYDEVNVFVQGRGMDMPITETEFEKYFVTGLAARVSFIRRQSFHIRLDDRWSMPSKLATIVAALGEVRMDPPGVIIRPRLAPGAENLVLSREDWDRISRSLRALRPLGIKMVDALESKKDGIPRVMSLTAIGEDETVEWVSTTPFSATDAWIASACGLRTDIDMSRIFSSHPLMVPPYQMGAAEIVAFETEFHELEVTK